VSGSGAADPLRLDQLTLPMIASCRSRIRYFLPASLLLLVCGQVLAAQEFAQRIVTLAPNLTELVYAAGAGDRLVGTVEFSDFPPVARQIPRVGDAFRVDYETLRRLRPDLILSWQSGNPRDVIAKLRQLGYRIVELEPQAFEDIARQVELIGELAGTQIAAEEAARKFRKQIQALREEYAQRTSLQVFFQISAKPWFTVSGQHLINEAIKLCGGVNVFDGLPGVAPSVSLEAIVRTNPDVIIAAEKTGDSDWRKVWEGKDMVNAVAYGQLYGVHADVISRSTPRIVGGVEQICRALDTARRGPSERKASLDKVGLN